MFVRIVSLMLTAAAAMTASLPATAQDVAARASLELKGLPIGMTANEVRAARPDAKCGELGPVLQKCSDAKQTLNERDIVTHASLRESTPVTV